MHLITCEHLSFEYEGKSVIDDLSFTVEDQDYLVIAGENGAGKSTLVKGLLDLKKPSGGRIVFDPSLRPKDIGYLPQQTPVQKDFPASVGEVVQSGCLNHLGWKPFYTLREKTIAYENMEKLGITQLKNRCYRDLSGGQQQRVLLARALCAARRIILLDEPAAGLDPIVTRDLYRLIENINEKLDITVIMVSHDIRSVLKYAKHVLHISRDGLFFGTTEEYEESAIGRAFTGGASHA
ncbi:MAG: metal ABC transporter ATP-binding protein [Anaerovoracaceae bacterium]|jgi:zinc transport system ATP-binding protein